MITFCIPHYLTNFTDKELHKKVKELHNFCSSQFSKSHYSKSKKDKELQLLTEILCKSSSSQLKSLHSYSLIACAIKILLKYSDTILYLDIEISERKRRSRYHLAKENYIKLLKNFGAEKPKETIEVVIDVIHNENVWRVRRVCVDLITCLFECGFNGSVVCHELCNKIDYIDKPKNIDTKLIVKVLYEILHIYHWPEAEETLIFIERLLSLYYKSLHNVSEQQSENAFYANLRGSLELCVRHIIQNITNYYILIIIHHMTTWCIKEDINDNIILNYGSTLEYAAYVHQTDSLDNTLTSEILSLLMQMIGSNARFVSLLGNRVLQYLIDRGKNKMLFNTPKIFFEGMPLLHIQISKYQREDRKFLKKRREIIHDSLTKSIINHRSSRLNLEATYCTICLLAIEIPCGFTAAALCCLMMSLQETIRKNQETIGKESSYHIHAIIISVLSFVCWIHDAKDFHAYVNKIVMERAQWAPHLNPPLQSTYNFAVHHVLWDKPELYLDDWEVRYGLWKRFRLNESPRRRRKKVINKKTDTKN